MLSSDSEGLSLAMLEAMGSGTVPIVTDVGDIGAALRDAGAGAAIGLTDDETANVRAMAIAAAALLDDAGEWRRQSVLSHNFVRDRHSLEATQADWRKVLGLGGAGSANASAASR